MVKEKSTYETVTFVWKLEDGMGLSIRMIKVGNVPEFVNDGEETTKAGAFEKFVIGKCHSTLGTPLDFWPHIYCKTTFDTV